MNNRLREFAGRSDLVKIMKSAFGPRRSANIEVGKLETPEEGIYTFRLDSTGEREGYSEIRIEQKNGKVSLRDAVTLPRENSGFQGDISRLKYCMYVDEGALSQGGVMGLFEANGILSFNVDQKVAYHALHHYLHTSAEIMSKFFKGFGNIDLAFSMARPRIHRPPVSTNISPEVSQIHGPAGQF